MSYKSPDLQGTLSADSADTGRLSSEPLSVEIPDPAQRLDSGPKAPGLPFLDDDRLTFGMSRSAVNGESFALSVEHGLSAAEKTLSCRWFYDRRGSELFEQICTLPEYYLTRVERSILESSAADIAGCCGVRNTLIELGSGSSVKTQLLIDAFHRRQGDLTYCPIDISPEILYQSAVSLLEQFPRLRVRALAAEYVDGLQRAGRETAGPHLLLFLGSTLGNFDSDDAVSFLRQVRRHMAPEDRLLLGADLQKSPAIIQAAYNDSAGITEAFNKNLLARINQELGGEFDLESFDHHAPYQADSGRIEMRLISRVRQTVSIGALSRSFSFVAGEAIHTESCHKYTETQLAGMASRAGLAITHTFTDPDRWFAVLLLRPQEDARR